MYHYSYVFPDQVYNKIKYYKKAVSKENCIDNYFESIYLPWVYNRDRDAIEARYHGVHEFKPEYRGNCYTKEFVGSHPQIIQDKLPELTNMIGKQLENYHV